MQQGRNPTRRNRNIGTSKQGHGKANRLVVPRAWADSVYVWRRSQPHTVVTRTVWGRELPFLVEHTRADCVHASTVDDVATMLNLLPQRHLDTSEFIHGIQGVVLRQQTRKEDLLSPVWARLGYGVDVGPVTGPAIFLAAQPAPLRLKWGRWLVPYDQRRLSRLQAAATSAHFDGRHHQLVFDPDAVRRVQLFFSVPHEVGHWADMLENVKLPGRHDFDEWERLWDRFWQRPEEEREVYANRYAEAVVARLRAAGQVPFERILDPDQLVAEGLRPEDFPVTRRDNDA